LSLLLTGTILAMPAQAQPTCVAPSLSDQQIKEIVDRERAARSDLPRPYTKSRWEVRKEGCHYTYVEYAVPETPDASRVFKLNQRGVIVDAPGMKCPDSILGESELAAVVKKAREDRRDLPPPFATQRTMVRRLRCLYLYFEYNQPERRGDYQVFTIDRFGELMEFSRSQPY
jgi:hypothetical protein